MVFHKLSPTICIILSVLLLFLSQETLSRELIQVAPSEDKAMELDGWVCGSRPIRSSNPSKGKPCPPPPRIIGTPLT